MKKILGIDVGSNSIGWGLITASDSGLCSDVVALGSRIFMKAIQDDSTKPKNVQRRTSRLLRRVLERRARRKRNLANYLISQNLLPAALSDNFHQEGLLNSLGDPYELRAKALDDQLKPYELGRVLLHFVARRGFLSSRKSLLGDLVDDPDMQAYLNEVAEESAQGNSQTEKEEKQFLLEISILRNKIILSGKRSLGEYLFALVNSNKRNRKHAFEIIRTDRAMYHEEFTQIWQQQTTFFAHLPNSFIEKVEKIIFYQRPLKLKKNRIGKCSLERNKYRAKQATLQAQQFRYLQDINNLIIYQGNAADRPLTHEEKEKLYKILEQQKKITYAVIKKKLGLPRTITFNLQASKKELQGNETACNIRSVIGEVWDNMEDLEQEKLVEDLLTMKKKSALKRRLINHWGFSVDAAIQLCLLEFPAGHSNLSLKALNKLLPHLYEGNMYSDARIKAGYEVTQESKNLDRLGSPPVTCNPIVNKGLHELRRLVNAIIAEYGKPDIIRVEMARDLEQNTKRYKAAEKTRKANETRNEKAATQFASLMGPHHSKKPSLNDKIKYRLWQDQNKLCAYSCQTIAATQVFSLDTEIDHILPRSKSLDNSYPNKVICFSQENQEKHDTTPFMAWGGNPDKWRNMLQAANTWKIKKKLRDNKLQRFKITAEELKEIARGAVTTQLNDTRYIAREALTYLATLGCDTHAVKGHTTAWLRGRLGFNFLLNVDDTKNREDHRHHAVDAVVIAATSRQLYQKIVDAIKQQQQHGYKAPLILDDYARIRQRLLVLLQHVTVSYIPQYQLTGALHESRGLGFITVKEDNTEITGTVNRTAVDKKLNSKRALKIIDKQVRELILAQLTAHNNNPKEAFIDNNYPLHKDGKTPIKRVRIWKTKISTEKLHATKLAIHDQAGKVFKWCLFGNTHHVEVIKEKATGKIASKFITMYAASCRLKGIGVAQSAAVITNHGQEYEFIMALHINDTVSLRITGNDERVLYRVQKFSLDTNTLFLCLNVAATLHHKNQQLSMNINTANFEKYQPMLHKVNAIGQVVRVIASYP